MYSRFNVLTVAIIVATAIYSNAQSPIDSRSQEIAIVHVNIIPMEYETVLTDQTLTIKDGKIKSIGSSNRKPRKGTLIIDGTGSYLMPGLAEMHAHVPPNDDVEQAKEVLFLFAANGITTIRGMLGHPKHLELRHKINEGVLLGPHFYTAGPSLNGGTVKSPEAGEAMVRNQKIDGYDFLKILPGLTKESFAAIARTAQEVGMPFVGHVSYSVGVWQTILAGQSTIDHLDGFIEGIVPGIDSIKEQQAGLFAMFIAHQADTTRIPKLMSELKEHKVWVVPTQTLADRWFSPQFNVDTFLRDPANKYIKKETIDSWVESKKEIIGDEKYDEQKMEDFITLRRHLIKACQQHGVGLLLGSDAPQVFNVPGSSAHYELESLVRSGLTPYQALTTGTTNVAAYLNVPQSGVVKVGAIADLVLLSGNPLTDIKNTRKIKGVMLNGRWLSREYLDSGLKKIVK